MPRPPTSPKIFSRMGLSEAASAILLVSVAIALLSITFIFGQALVQSQAREARLTILEARALKLGSNMVLRLSIGNTGTEPLTLTSVTLAGTGCSYTFSVELGPGERFTDTLPCGSSPPPGARLTLTVKALTRDGREVGDSVWVAVEA